jgi:hypothetical protein
MQMSAKGQSVSWQQLEQNPSGFPQHKEALHWERALQAVPGKTAKMKKNQRLVNFVIENLINGKCSILLKCTLFVRE